ncbi:MAG: hypothetical protein CSH37_05810 [Thalassolituus sp.]|jgi:hypothetical protein|uniref:Lipoprotein n=1 Tax=Thalassolituus maritimus TaxID=484498 RepID=A0ABP9ZZR7_9GAMM|nr:MAG: hypothetical protein CSH37_05810 [Thalassolituus sp.]
MWTKIGDYATLQTVFKPLRTSELRALLLFMIVVLTGCELGQSPFADTSNRELRERNYKCQMASSLSAAEIQVCKNIRRECDARAEKGNFVC